MHEFEIFVRKCKILNRFYCRAEDMKRKALMIKIPKDTGMFYKLIPGNISNIYFTEIARKCISFYDCMAEVVFFFIYRVTQRVESLIEYP